MPANHDLLVKITYYNWKLYSAGTALGNSKCTIGKCVGEA